MAAVPFKGIIETMDAAGNAGPAYRFSASDVANAFCTFDDLPGTPSFVQFGPGLRLAGIKLSATGTDTKALQITRGVAATERIIRQAPLVETLAIDDRQRLGQAYGAQLVPGAQYGLKQLA